MPGDGGRQTAVRQRLRALLREENIENSFVDSGSFMSEGWEEVKRFRSLTLLLKTS